MEHSSLIEKYYFSSLTVNFFLPFALLLASTFLPFFGFHSFSETMLVFSFPVAWLICSFHFLLLVNQKV